MSPAFPWIALIAFRSAMFHENVLSHAIWTFTMLPHNFVFTLSDSCIISMQRSPECSRSTVAQKKDLFSASLTITVLCSMKSRKFCFIQDKHQRTAFVCFPVLFTTWNFLSQWCSVEVRQYIEPRIRSCLSHSLLFVPISTSQISFIAFVVASV